MDRTEHEITHSAHWGSFLARVKDGEFVGVRPFPGDPAPSPIMYGLPEVLRSPTRIDRPYVREGWLRGDRRGGTPRGGDAFVPLDWDAAVRLVGSELQRVRNEFGSASIFGGSNGWSSAGRFHHAKSQLQRMLAATGGYTGGLTNYSYGAVMTLMPRLVGSNQCVEGPVVDWRAIARRARLLVCFGGIVLRNSQVVAGGCGRHDTERWLREAASAGVRFVYVSPVRGALPADVPAGALTWIPIRPGTDAALMLAMAHVLITSGRIDHAFLERCTVGFEALRREVVDGGRTPAWAETITGVPAAMIRALAEDCAAQPTLLTANWSLQRAEYGEQPCWALLSLACLLGHIGQPGLGFSFGQCSTGGMGTPRVPLRAIALPAIRNPVDTAIPVALISDMLEKPGQEYDYNGARRRFPHIRLIYWAGGNPFHHHQNLNRFLAAWARAETIVVHEPWWTALARHADIVLPATTTMERNDIASSSRDRFLIAMKRIVAPRGQARADYDMLADIAETAGARERYTEGRDEGQWLRHLYEAAREDAAKKGVALADFDTFWEAGSVEVPVPEEHFVPFRDFVRDPAAHPLATPSGRIELSSETIASFGYPDCPGHATWLEPREYLGAPLAARYPLHLLSPQPPTRLHGQIDQAGESLSNKIRGREPLLMHEDDARARNLQAGDIVRVYNDRGACLAGLRLSRDLLPRVVLLPAGAWFDPLEPGRPGSLCVHGNPNVLTSDVATSRFGQGCSAHSCLIEVERWEGPLPEIKVHAPPPIRSPVAGVMGAGDTATRPVGGAAA